MLYSGCNKQLLTFDSVKADCYFHEAITFLEDYKWIYNFPMTDIFTSNVLNSMPLEWKTALIKLSSEELNEVPFGLQKSDWPSSLQNFAKRAVWLGSLRFSPPPTKADALQRQHMYERMPLKKREEVVAFSSQIAAACRSSRCSNVLDVGSGLGYLGQVLHQTYGFTVVGLESEGTRCHAAKERLLKTGGCSKNIHNFPMTVTSDAQATAESIRSVLHNLAKPQMCKCRENLPKDHQLGKWVVVALHACGSSIPSLMRVFGRVEELRTLLCIGCCYHKMNDRNSGSVEGFPTSEGLGTIGPLDVFALRLASEETRARWRTRSPSESQERAKHVAYRGALQLFFHTEGTRHWNKPRRRLSKKSFASFETYVKEALTNHDRADGQHRRLKEMVLQYESLKPLLPLVSPLMLLQVLLQPVLEAVIVLDRYTYLKESGFQTDIFQMFDDFLSPRNLAVLANKKNGK